MGVYIQVLYLVDPGRENRYAGNVELVSQRRPRNPLDRYDHLSDSSVTRFAQDTCDPDEVVAIEAHILTCPECVARLTKALARVPPPAEH
jgi:hypothetical protein